MDRCENVMPNKLKETRSGNVGDVCRNVCIGVTKIGKTNSNKLKENKSDTVGDICGNVYG